MYESNSLLEASPRSPFHFFSMKVTFDAQSQPVIIPYDNGSRIGRNIYRRLPNLTRHDSLSTHSVGWIWGNADATSRGLVFNGPIRWSFGATDEIAEALIESLAEDPELIEGLVIEGGRPVQPSGGGRYRAESPILVRDGDEHLSYDHPNANEYLTRNARQKLSALGIPEELATEVSVSFQPNEKAKTKIATVCGNQFRANQCPVYIDAPHPALEEGLMTTGLGGLTALGLGAIIPDSESS
jgi:hypothetical protein